MTDLELKTVPKKAGPLMIRTLDVIQASTNPLPAARATALTLMYCFIEERNKGKVDLTRPKGLSINSVCDLLRRHFAYKYKTNAPRLPQVAIYALYSCLVKSVGRYASFELQPLERLKTANRKSGTVGDIDIQFQGKPVEAVEVKFDIEVNADQVSEAIAKIKSASVERYFILSTKGIVEPERKEIETLCDDFRKSNGCEIIVGDALDTVGYCLRFLRSTNDFINQYVDLLEADADLDYEHRLAWNDVCATDLSR
jgi:DNA (cytosine-5)-methyltransferase 1